MSNSLDADQARRIVGPDLGQECFPTLSANDTGRQRVNPHEMVLTEKNSYEYHNCKYCNFPKICCDLPKNKKTGPIILKGILAK